MKKIAFVTGSRADYGIMRRYLSLLGQDQDIDLKIMVTGALLSEKFGHQVELIYEDGFEIAAEINVDLDSSSNKTILHTMAQTLDKFAETFAESTYDLLVILGDRYEMLSVAIAAAMQKLPILHIHGGEATYGNYDEFIRHCITKMSLYHFTVTDEYRNRVIQLGEKPDNVYCLGALGAENCLLIDEEKVPAEIMEMNAKQYFVVLFHPETLTNADALTQVNQLLEAVSHFFAYKFVFLGTNADTQSDIIRERVKNYVLTHNNAIYYENLHTDAYHYLLKNSICLIGNSSSGIIEAPSLGIYTVNIGERQAGRVRGNSIIDTECRCELIINAINGVLERYKDILPVNPYYRPNTANEYYITTKEILQKLEMDVKEPKIFYNL